MADRADIRQGGVHIAVPHESGAAHVTGQAVYADDIAQPADLVHCHLATATIAAGRVTHADLAAVRTAPGVIAVLTGADIPGENEVGPVIHDEPMLALDGGEKVHFAGQPLFMVVAETLAAARRAAALAVVSYEATTPILTIDDAVSAGSYLSEPYRMAKGDVQAALAAAPHRLDGQVDIGGQDHFYLEGQVALAWAGEGAEMHVVSSNQHPSECQIVVARVLGVPSNQVTVEVRRLGGGFGGKETQANLMAAGAALAARLTGRPAKLRMDRDQDMIVTGKRHEFRIAYDVAFDDRGQILGLRTEQFARCGWSTDLSHAIADRAMFHADNCYFIPAAEIVSHRLRTNTVSNTAFRGFGGPQGMVGVERVVQRIAYHLGLDPFDVRRANFYEPPGGSGERSVTPYGMAVQDCVIAEIADDLAGRADYRTRRDAIAGWNRDNPVIKRGIALTPVRFGISFTTTHLNQAGALVHIYADGSVMINHGGVEMGQGLQTKVMQVAASTLGVDLDSIRATPTRTDKVPNTSATAASSGADLNGMAVARACQTLIDRLSAFAADHWGGAVAFGHGEVSVGGTTIRWADLISAAYLARIQLSATGFYATPDIHWDREKADGRPFLYFAYGAAVTEVAVDTLTGEARMLRADILHDAGQSLNPAIDLGQVEGGFLQGAGWLMMEELVWDDKGHLKTHAPSTYKIPCASDRPPVMNVALWEKGRNPEPTIRRSKAVGEPPLMLAISAFEAVAEAVAATVAATVAAGGGRYPQLDSPAVPQVVLAALASVAK